MTAGHLLWGLVLLSSLVFSCGSGAPQIPEELLNCCQGGVAGAASTNYPKGPYGSEVGDTIEDFVFQGYVAPHQNGDMSEIAFSDFYDPSGEQGHRLLLLNTAAAWCQPCAIEHSDLPSRVEEHAGKGLVVLSALFQDEAGDPAGQDTLDTWVRNFDTNFPMVLDPGYQMGRYGPANSPPVNLIVDPVSMQLVARFIGNQEGPMWAFIENELNSRGAQ